MDTPVAAPPEQQVYGLIPLWVNGNIVTRATLVVLIIMSLGSWFIIITKVWDQRTMKKSAKIVEKSFWTADSIKEGVDRLPKGNDFRFIAEDGLRAASHHEGRLTDRIDLHEWITMALQRATDEVNGNLTNGLAFLATVGSTAPFVGLFGTVMGILNALIAIGVAGQASIDKVAGPVATTGCCAVTRACRTASATSPATCMPTWWAARASVVAMPLQRAHSANRPFVASLKVPAPCQ
jgi:biopolymer transport protein ExbB